MSTLKQMAAALLDVVVVIVWIVIVLALIAGGQWALHVAGY